MLKKAILVGGLLAAGVAVAAPAPYVGVSTGVSNMSADKGISYRGMPFNLFAGYGGMVNSSIYLAGELNATVANAQLSDPADNSLKSTYGYGLSVLPGVMLSDHTMAFARAGVVRTRFSSANASKTGAQFGLGLQTSLTQNIDIRGEYDYTAYQSFNRAVDDETFSISPRNDAFIIGLIYKID